MARSRTVALSSIAVSVLSTITLLCGIVVLGTGIWLATKHSTDCVRFLERPVIAIGTATILVSLAGIAGSLMGIRGLLALYLVTMLLAILTLFAFTLFTFVVTSGRNGHGIAGKVYKEFAFDDYSDWLRNRVEDRRSWRLITSCIKDSEVCQEMAQDYKTLQAFDQAELSPIESGCCKPPVACGYQFRNATNWFGAISPEKNPDCYRWNKNDLCFGCDSCKAGLLQQVKDRWRTVAIIDVIVLALMILAYSAAVCAFSGVAPR